MSWQEDKIPEIDHLEMGNNLEEDTTEWAQEQWNSKVEIIGLGNWKWKNNGRFWFDHDDHGRACVLENEVLWLKID